MHPGPRSPGKHLGARPGKYMAGGMWAGYALSCIDVIMHTIMMMFETLWRFICLHAVPAVSLTTLTIVRLRQQGDTKCLYRQLDVLYLRYCFTTHRGANLGKGNMHLWCM